MAIAEVYKNGTLLRSRDVDDAKAARGITIKLGDDIEVRVALGETKSAGAYRVTLRAGSLEPVGAGTRVPPHVHTAATAASAATATGVDQSAPTASFAPAPTRAAPQPPSLDGYQILGPLGHGGMGFVWRAVQTATQRHVALKVMSSGLAGSDHARARFQREVKLAAALEHPGIARIYDSGLHKGSYFYAMQLVEGEHLDAFARHNMLDHRAAAELVHKICQGIGFAHSHGVIHRDLKPANILVTTQGEPVIVDFGLARGFEESAGSLAVSIEGQAAGTPAYMSPEQAAGRHTDVDRRADVYALGCILYRLVTGRPPHDMSGPAHEVMRRIIEDDVRPPGLFSSIDPDLEAVLLCACAHDRNARYGSATEMGEDLQRFLNGVPVEARRYTTTEHLKRSAKRNSSRILRYAGAAVLLIVAAGGIFWGIQHARQAKAAADALVVAAHAEKSQLEEQLAVMQTEAAKLRKMLAAGNGGTSAAELAAARTRLAELEIQMVSMQSRLRDLHAQVGAPAVAAAAPQPEPETPPTPAAPVRPTPAAPVATGPNAADIYLAVHATLGDQFHSAIASSGASAPDLRKHQAEVQRLIQATTLPCDFGTDWSPGIKTVLPYLGKMRALARLLNAEAELRFSEGDLSGTAKCQAAILRMAVHIQQPAKAIIESLVALAVAQLAVDFINSHPTVASSAAKAELRAALEAARDRIVPQLPATVQSDTGIASRSLRDGTFDMREFDPKARDWSKVSKAERDALADKLDKVGTDMAAAWNAPDAETRLDVIAKRAAAEGLSEFFPSYQKTRATGDKVASGVTRALTLTR